MRGQTAKHLRAIIPQTEGDEFSRRVYRRMKKFYTRKVPHHLKADFLDAAELAFKNQDTGAIDKLLK